MCVRNLTAPCRCSVDLTAAGGRTILSEYLMCHVGVYDSAHQRPTDRRVSSMKNRP